MPFVVFIAAPPVEIMRNMHEFARQRGKTDKIRTVSTQMCMSNARVSLKNDVEEHQMNDSLMALCRSEISARLWRRANALNVTTAPALTCRSSMTILKRLTANYAEQLKP